jgi:transcriptional regulator with XRE-family HTH domain
MVRTMVTRSVTPIDIEVGKRIRLRRIEKGLSQTELGDHLGITFQQVQKYENGVNRVGASRLNKIAELLQVPISFFFHADGGVKSKTEKHDIDTSLFANAANSVRLLKAFSKIDDEAVQRKIIALVESISDRYDGGGRKK